MSSLQVTVDNLRDMRSDDPRYDSCQEYAGIIEGFLKKPDDKIQALDNVLAYDSGDIQEYASILVETLFRISL